MNEKNLPILISLGSNFGGMIKNQKVEENMQKSKKLLAVRALNAEKK